MFLYFDMKRIYHLVSSKTAKRCSLTKGIQAGLLYLSRELGFRISTSLWYKEQLLLILITVVVKYKPSKSSESVNMTTNNFLSLYLNGVSLEISIVSCSIEHLSFRSFIILARLTVLLESIRVRILRIMSLY